MKENSFWSNEFKEKMIEAIRQGEKILPLLEKIYQIGYNTGWNDANPSSCKYLDIKLEEDYPAKLSLTEKNKSIFNSKNEHSDGYGKINWK